MKTYHNLEEVKADIKDGKLIVNDSVKFTFPICIEASMQIRGNIYAGDIHAWNIYAGNIHAENIDAWSIDAENIDARNIDAGSIYV